MKKSEIMPFEAAWMQLEIIILSDMSEREQIPYDITSLWNLKYSTNEPIYERETDSQTQKIDYGCQGGGMGEGWNGSLGLADADCSI